MKNSTNSKILDKFKKKVVPRITDKTELKNSEPASEVVKTTNTLSEHAENYLRSVLDNPELSVTQHGKRLGLSAYIQTKSKKDLLVRGLVRELTLNLGKEYGGNVKILELTEDGYKHLGIKKTVPKEKGRESPEHRFYKNKIASCYRKKGFKVAVEFEKNGVFADVAVFNGNEVVAIEVELSTINAIQNIINDLKVFNRVIVCCKNAALKRQIEKEIKEHIDESSQSKVKTCLLSDYPLKG